MLIVGIDPGLSGAVAVVEYPDDGGRYIRALVPMPIIDHEVDVYALSVLLPRDADLVVIERVWGDAKFGGSRSFTFGQGFGMVLAAIKLARLTALRVPPMTWKNAILPDSPHDKSASIALALQLFPRANLVLPRKRTPSHDLAEALLLAEYGARYSRGEYDG